MGYFKRKIDHLTISLLNFVSACIKHSSDRTHSQLLIVLLKLSSMEHVYIFFELSNLFLIHLNLNNILLGSFCRIFLHSPIFKFWISEKTNIMKMMTFRNLKKTHSSYLEEVRALVNRVCRRVVVRSEMILTRHIPILLVALFRKILKCFEINSTLIDFLTVFSRNKKSSMHKKS